MLDRLLESTKRGQRQPKQQKAPTINKESPTVIIAFLPYRFEDTAISRCNQHYENFTYNRSTHQKSTTTSKTSIILPLLYETTQHIQQKKDKTTSILQLLLHTRRQNTNHDKHNHKQNNKQEQQEF